jgi:two-component system, LytTR family, response regulator
MSFALKVLIVEDETPAAEKLERYLQRYNPAITIAEKLTTVREAVDWIKIHGTEVDLIFMDIQLHDGQSFQIFKEVEIVKPVIFITAYNEFALDAFKVNGLDYLLKPITFSDLSSSLKKLEKLGSQLQWDSAKNNQVTKSLAGESLRAYKTRFMVKLGDHIRSITTDQISFFYADGRDVYLITNPLRKFIIDYTLESLEEILDPVQFYRLNRSYIISISAIQDVIVYSNSRLKVTSNLVWDQEIIVSREKVSDFKNWFDGNARENGS